MKSLETLLIRIYFVDLKCNRSSWGTNGVGTAVNVDSIISQKHLMILNGIEYRWARIVQLRLTMDYEHTEAILWPHRYGKNENWLWK